MEQNRPGRSLLNLYVPIRKLGNNGDQPFPVIVCFEVAIFAPSPNPTIGPV